MPEWRKIELALVEYFRTEKYDLQQTSDSGDIIAYIDTDSTDINLTDFAKYLGDRL